MRYPSALGRGRPPVRHAGFPRMPSASTGRLSGHRAGSSSSGPSTVAPARHLRGCSIADTWRFPERRTRRVPAVHAARSSGRRSLAASASHRTRWRNAPKLPNKALNPMTAPRGRPVIREFGEGQSLGELCRSLRHRPSTHQVPRMRETSSERQFFLDQRFTVELILLPVGKCQPRNAGGECADEVWESGGHIVGGRLWLVLGGGNQINQLVPKFFTPRLFCAFEHANVRSANP